MFRARFGIQTKFELKYHPWARKTVFSSGGWRRLILLEEEVCMWGGFSHMSEGVAESPSSVLLRVTSSQLPQRN